MLGERLAGRYGEISNALVGVQLLAAAAREAGSGRPKRLVVRAANLEADAIHIRDVVDPLAFAKVHLVVDAADIHGFDLSRARSGLRAATGPDSHRP